MLTRRFWVLVAVLTGVFAAYTSRADECHNRCGTIMSCSEAFGFECSDDAHDFTRDACFNPEFRLV